MTDSSKTLELEIRSVNIGFWMVEKDGNDGGAFNVVDEGVPLILPGGVVLTPTEACELDAELLCTIGDALGESEVILLVPL